MMMSSLLSEASDMDVLDSSSDTPRDEDDFLRDPLAKEMQNRCPRLRRLDPLFSKLDDYCS